MLEQKYPHYILNGMTFDIPTFDVGNDETNKLLTLLMEADQFYSRNDALDYAQHALLEKDIRQFDAMDFIVLAKRLNEIAAQHLMPLTCSGGLQAGIYCSTPPLIVSETGIAGKKFDDNSADPEKNAALLKKIYGKKSAEDYVDFCYRLKEAMGSIFEDLTIDANYYHTNRKSVREFVLEHGLEEHPGYVEYCKIFKELTLPNEIPNKMFILFSELVELIQSDASGFEIAAKALLLGHVHPFHNGNGRIARILANTILIKYNLYPINFNENKSFYYEAFENADGDHLLLVGFLEEMSQASRASYERAVEEGSFLSTDKRRLNLSISPEYEKVLNRNNFGYDVMPYSDGIIEQYKLIYIASKTSYDPSTMDEHFKGPDFTKFAGALLPDSLKNSDPRMIYEGMNRALSRAFFERNVSRIDSDWCFREAESLLSCHPELSGYLFYRAAIFSEEEENFSTAIKGYKKAAEAYCFMKKFDGAYDMAVTAKYLAEQQGFPEEMTEINGLLEDLVFVRYCRDEVLKNQNISSEYLLPLISDKINEGRRLHKTKSSDGFKGAIAQFESVEALCLALKKSESCPKKVDEYLSRSYFFIAFCYKGLAKIERYNYFHTHNDHAIDYFKKAYPLAGPKLKVQIRAQLESLSIRNIDFDELENQPDAGGLSFSHS